MDLLHQIMAMINPLMVILIVVGVIGFALVVRYGTDPANPAASRRAADGREYVWKLSYTKNRLSASRLRLAAHIPADFALEEEGFWHRLSSSLGFCNEFQTPDEVFNQRVFIMADSTAICEKFAMDGKLKQAVVAAFNAGAQNISFKSSKHGHVDILLKRPIAILPEEQERPLVDALYTIAESLGKLTENDTSWIKSRYLRNMFATINWVLLAVTLCLGVRNFTTYHNLVEWTAFWPLFGQWLLYIMVPYILLIRFLVGGLSYGHKVFMEFLLVGSWGLALTIGNGLLYVNSAYDTSADVVREEYILDKYTTHSKRRTHYHITVSDWKNPGKGRDFTVNINEYDHAQTGNIIKLYLRPGHLGIEWMSHYSLVRQ